MRRRLLIVCALVSMASAARADDADLVKRGEYLARAGDCIACHTPPGAPPYSGGRKIDTPYGPIYSPNLTPDKETGIGAWSDDDFYRAMHEGLGKNGEYLYPVFPFPWYTNVTRDDALAIKAYLSTLKPVHSPDKPNGFSFPYNVRTALAAWRLAFFRAAEPKAPAPGDKIGRGAISSRASAIAASATTAALRGALPIGAANTRAARYRAGMRPISPATLNRA